MTIIALIALTLGIDMKLKETTAVGTIGGADGPTAIFVAGKLGDEFTIGVIISVIVLICVGILIYKRFMKK